MLKEIDCVMIRVEDLEAAAVYYSGSQKVNPSATRALSARRSAVGFSFLPKADG
jgi:hypothetical protein